MTDAQRMKATYNFEKVDRMPRCEFFFWEATLKRWHTEGWNGDLSVFGFDSPDASKPGLVTQPIDLGWCDIPVCPPVTETVIDRTDRYEYARNSIGEIKMYFNDDKQKCMPTFVKAAVESDEDWRRIKPMLDPDIPERWEGFDDGMEKRRAAVESGEALFDVRMIGAYMYLRSLCGPEGVMYVFYDAPDMVRDMLETWRNLLIACLARMQDRLPFFKIFFAEDIAYKGKSLISPKMVEDFLMPYYREIVETLRPRQKERFHVEVDTDGNPDDILPIYAANGFTAWTPCEAAAGCDIVDFGIRYPALVISGGIDKRVLAKGKEAIRRELDRIIPYLKRRGGYIPTCDHGVPDDVSFENYLFYREYMTELDSY